MSTSAERAGGQHLRVVLAEDDDEYALLVGMALERASRGPVDVRRARDGDEALRLVQDDAPDLLLLDLQMPGRSGHEVLEGVKGDERLRRVAVAVLTASDRDEDVARSYGLGGNHFLTKPSDPAELQKRLERLLANLADLSGIRRGAGGIEPTGATLQGPGSARNRALLGWSMLVVILAALLVYALSTGVL